MLKSTKEVMASPLLVFSSSMPTTIPSIIFGIFCSRTVVYCIRLAWSLNVSSDALGLVSAFILCGFEFFIVMGIYTLLTDWVRLITKSSDTSNSSKGKLFMEILLVNITKFILPVCGVLGAVQVIQEYEDDGNAFDNSSKGILRKVSTLGFLICLTLYMVYVTYFAVVYVKKPISQQLHVMLLYTSGALLYIELVYRTFITFAQATDSTNKYEWMIYVFEAMPELVLLGILGGIILGDWFFEEIPETVKTNDLEIGTNEWILGIVQSAKKKINA
ncbi:21900_t:CDS:2 [Dentiscutata erythropus]|uniref:21900_t:CDS:1 n=1 Tax=Dentiscutata erythropus TaxID=1348616 RepID=A0A9N8YT08_9GLOM|nr:21900_t:CDS:2 [Dentiscutata erythropus]